MLRSSGSRKRSTRRGASAVEFALVAPTFFLLVLGIIAFGRMLMVQEVLVNAARRGPARRSSRAPPMRVLPR